MSVWEWVSGQERVVPLLQAEADRPSDAYLFVGPQGVGKVEAARALAAAVLCDSGGCGKCSVCSRVRRGLHADVFIYEPEGYTYPVGLIREMVAAAGRSPLESSRRVFIVQEADRIVERAQNALLKALEEPGASVTWLLVAQALDPFLPTVLSRCRVVQFAPITDEVITEDLEVSATDGDVDWIVKAARGDLEAARALATSTRARAIRELAISYASAGNPDPRVAFGVSARLQELVAEASREAGERLSTEVAEIEGAAATDKAAATLRRRLQDRHKRVLRRVEGDLYLDFLSWLGTAFRDLALLAAGGSPEAVSAPDALERLQGAATLQPPAVWLDLLEAVHQARLAIIENANPPLSVESVLVFTIERTPE